MGLSVAGILGKITGNAAGSLVKDLGDTVDKFIDTKGEKAERDLKIQELVDKHSEFIVSQANEIEKEYLLDTQDARSSFTKIQESDKASWLAKNIMPLLTITVTVGFFGLLIYMLKYEVPKSNERIMDILLGSLGTAWITMIGFYFGSSKSSEDKSKFIHENMQK